MNLNIDFLIVPDRTTWLMEALQCFQLNHLPIFTVREISGDYFDKIIMANEFDAEGFIAPDVKERFDRIDVRQPSRPYPFNSRRIYVSRRLNIVSRPRYRNLLNEEEMEAHFKRVGFDVVFPECLPFLEQVSLFRDSKMIVGTSGSGMLNAVFGRQGVKVLDLESFHYTVRQHAKIYASTQKQYAFAFGQLEPDESTPPYLRNWRISGRVVLDATDWLMS